MVQMVKMLDILLVGVVTLHRVLDISCSGIPLGPNGDSSANTNVNLQIAETSNFHDGGNKDIHNNSFSETGGVSAGKILRRCTSNTFAIAVCIFVGIIVFLGCLGLMVGKVVGNSNKIEKIEMLNTSMTTPGYSSHMDFVTTALSTRLPTTSEPAPVIVTYKTETPEVLETSAKATTLPEEAPYISTEALTTFEPIIPPSPECTTIGENVYSILYDISSSSTETNIRFDSSHTEDVTKIKTELEGIEQYNCGTGFFEFESDENVISFNQNNKVTKSAINNVLCRKSAEKVMPLLNFLEPYDDSPNAHNAFTIPERKITSVMEGVGIAADKSCGSNFFITENINSGSIKLKFHNNNEYIVKEWKKCAQIRRCPLAAQKVVTILDLLDSYTEQINVEETFTETPNFRQKLLQAVGFADQLECGDGFFEITDNSNSVTILYQNDNHHVLTAWTNFLQRKNCQIAADGVISVLDDFNKNIGSTLSIIQDSHGKRRELLAAYEYADHYSCENGFINIQERKGNLRITYQSTNRYVRTAWDLLAKNNKCKSVAKDVLDFLLEIHFYSRDVDVSFSIPNNNNNFGTLRDKINRKGSYDCEDGFITLTEANNRAVISYDKINPYIRSEWESITDSEVCTVMAESFVKKFQDMNRYSTHVKHYVTIYADDSERNRLKRIIDMKEGLYCGNGFLSYTEGSSFLAVNYETANSYMSTAWTKLNEELHCRNAASAVVRILHQLGKYTTAPNVSQSIYNNEGKKSDLIQAINSSGNSHCGNGYFSYIEKWIYIIVKYQSGNKYIREAWTKALRN